ncbi:MAG: glutamylcysteine synthetase, partial [Lachnospiraceae bacterium]|nr:glutamylcysteine synthetase [Lachnospiraceae bacterium]
NVPVPNGRYRMLFHHLHTYDKYRTLPMYFHPHPEFGTFASASQVQLDVSYAEIPEVINTFSLLEPVKALIFSNSVLLNEAEDYLCYRDILWENSTHGINPHNVGPYEYIFKDTDELLDYIQSTSIYCAEREDKYVNFTPMPLREYFAQDEVEGEYYADGRYHKIIINPVQEDIDYLRSFKHEDLTYRGTIEFRSVCCQPIKDAMTVAAFHAGLKKKLHELTSMLEDDRVLYGHGYNASELRHLFIKKDLPSFVDRDLVYDLAERILRLSAEGLGERGLNEEKYLEPLFVRVKEKLNPASYMLEKMSSGSSVEDIIKEFARS